MVYLPRKVSALPAADALTGAEALNVVQGGASCRSTVEAVRLMPSHALAGLPVAAPAGSLCFVTDADGGAVPAYSDGTDWRRFDDNEVVT